MPACPHWSKWSSANSESGWSPLAAGSNLKVWLDATDNSTITQSGGLVSKWTDKSANAYTYSQATDANKPTISTLNGRQALVGNGTSTVLTMDSPTRILVSGTKHLVGFAVYVNSFPTHYPGPYCDGDGVQQAYMLFFSDDAPYIDLSVGPASGLARIRWDFDFNFSLPKAVTGYFTYNGVNNDQTGFAGTFNAAAQTTLLSDNYASNTAATRVFARSATAFFDGKIGEFIIITNYTAADVTNLSTYLTNRWGP